MMDRAEQIEQMKRLEKLEEEATALMRVLQETRELLRLGPLAEAGSGLGIRFTGGRFSKNAGRKLRARILEEAKQILSLDEYGYILAGDTDCALFGFHAGEEVIERAIIECMVRYLALQEGYQGAIEFQEVPFGQDLPRTEYTLPERWDTCMVHGMQIKDPVLLSRLARGNERRGLCLDALDSGEVICIRRMAETAVPQDKLDASCRALLASLIRSGEGTKQCPGVHPEGLAIEFYVDEERQETLRRLPLHPSADETTLEYLLNPWETMATDFVHRAHRALRRERGLTLTIEEAKALVNRLLAKEPRIFEEIRERFTHQFSSKPIPDDNAIRAMLLVICEFEVFICRLQDVAGVDFRTQIAQAIAIKAGQGLPLERATQEALGEVRSILEQALPALASRGHALGSEQARDVLTGTFLTEIASVLSQRLSRPDLVRLLITKAVRGYVEAYSGDSIEIEIDVSTMQAAMQKHVGALLMDQYGPVLYRHREKILEILDAAYRNSTIRNFIALLDELGPAEVLAKSEQEVIGVLLDIVLFDDLSSRTVLE